MHVCVFYTVKCVLITLPQMHNKMRLVAELHSGWSWLRAYNAPHEGSWIIKGMNKEGEEELGRTE